MPFRLVFTPEAEAQLTALEQAFPKKYKKVRKTLGHLEKDPSHPGLQAHKYDSVPGPNGEPLWEAYVENDTPAALRVFYSYGPGRNIMTINAILSHPR